MKTLLLILCTLRLSAQELISVSGQNNAYPLYSKIDSAKMMQIRNSKMHNEAKEMKMREYLNPFCDSNDVLACYILATTYDKFSYGAGTAVDAKQALKYYHKAAEGKMAEACFFLYQLYRYQLMQQAENHNLSLYYLNEAKKYGDLHMEAKCYKELAGIYFQKKENNYQSEMKGIKASNDSAKYYLLKALLLEPDDMWAIDFIASLYEQEKNYADAYTWYLKSRNENSLLKAANWMATGKKVNKDTGKAIKIVWNVLEMMQKEYGYTREKLFSYTGTYNPVIMLNIFYRCYGILSKQQIGEWHTTAVSCEDFGWLTSE